MCCFSPLRSDAVAIGIRSRKCPLPRGADWTLHFYYVAFSPVQQGLFLVRAAVKEIGNAVLDGAFTHAAHVANRNFPAGARRAPFRHVPRLAAFLVVTPVATPETRHSRPWSRRQRLLRRANKGPRRRSAPA